MEEPSSKLDTLRPSALIDGKYELLRLLGRGGMGSVWEARHLSLGRQFAIKFIDDKLANNVELLQRFQNEAKAAALLRSKHIIEVTDQGYTPERLPFLVMELLSGQSLRERLETGVMAPPEVLRIVGQVVKGLQRAHDARIFHRDLKPDNIFLHRDDDEEIAKILDFGIAKFNEALFDDKSLQTRTGTLLGTPSYMSPEQARGKKNLDGRADLWSLACIVYECLTGQLPFEGENLGDLLVNITVSDFAPPSGLNPALPAAFDAWMRKALAKDPAQRFASCQEFFSSLSEALTGSSDIPASLQSLSRGAAPAVAATALLQPSPVPAATAPPRAPPLLVRSEAGTLVPSSRRSGLPPLLIAAAVLGVLGLGAVGAFALRDGPRPPVAASVAASSVSPGPSSDLSPPLPPATPVAAPVADPPPSASASPSASARPPQKPPQKLFRNPRNGDQLGY